MNRRFFLLGSTSVLASAPARRALASPDGGDFASATLPDYGALLGPAGLTPQGLATPLPKEVAMARDIMAQAPSGKPHEIMAWLEALRETNQDGERYNEGWRDRWNPLIVGFFAGTGLTPSGDQTPWCAACINWCIERAGLKGTGSASSGSFRNGRGPSSPILGDVAVFRDDSRGPGRGHVGFYVGGGGPDITVLGANQLNERGHHGICRKAYSVRSGKLVLDSYHPLGADGTRRPAPGRPTPQPQPPRQRAPSRPAPEGGNTEGIGRW
jgi:uncharacterized protein (TIGR02594 family)